MVNDLVLVESPFQFIHKYVRICKSTLRVYSCCLMLPLNSKKVTFQNKFYHV